MLENISKINIVRIGNCISYSSLKEVGEKILESFRGMIEEFKIFHHESPFVDSIDALLLTMILHEEFGGHTLGITDADLKTQDKNEKHSVHGPSEMRQIDPHRKNHSKYQYSCNRFFYARNS